MLLSSLSALNTKNIILASGSPRRQKILEELGLHFHIEVSDFTEDLEKTQYQEPWQYALETARNKALGVYSRHQRSQKPFDLIISADTIVYLEGKIIEKPQNEDHAKQMLQDLSGRKHSVITAMILLTPSEDGIYPNLREFYEETFVEFAKIGADTIDSYVLTGIPMDKAGSYGIQDPFGGSFIRSIEGCYYNVLGIPLHRFCIELLECMPAL